MILEMSRSRGTEVLEGLPAELAAPEHARSIIDGWLQGVEARWPGTRIDLAQLTTWLRERLRGEVNLENVCGEDVVLAGAAVEGDAVALAAIDAALADEVERVLPARRDQDRHDELHQALREKLFVGAGKLEEYGGVGSLRRWLRMVVLRTHLDRERAAGRRPMVTVPDDELAASPATDDDPALAYLKRHYRAEVRAAVGEAVATLRAHSRILLRQHYLSRLTLDQLAGIYEVHPVTVSRWLAAARDELAKAVRIALARRLGVPSDELESILELVQTNLELSLQRLLDD
jgi:RNA polymerase sigma-70 factor, ECF subfamily